MACTPIDGSGSAGFSFVRFAGNFVFGHGSDRRAVIVRGLLRYYLAECLRDSALGGLRAPDPIERSGDNLDWQELIWHVAVILGCLALCAGPAVGYRIVTERNDLIFYLLVTVGVIGFPMMFLAVVMFDSFFALNPLLILGSMLSTFFPYGGVVIFFAGILSLGVWMVQVLPEVAMIHVFVELVFFYILADLVHGLGRFYYRYAENLTRLRRGLFNLSV